MVVRKCQGINWLTPLQGGGMWEGEEERLDVEDQLGAVVRTAWPWRWGRGVALQNFIRQQLLRRHLLFHDPSAQCCGAYKENGPGFIGWEHILYLQT